VETVRIEFVQRDAVFWEARRLKMIDDGERHEHGSRPVAHVPEIHMEPFADEQDFAGNCRHVFPGEQANQGEIQLGKRVHPGHAAEVQRHFARAQHAGIGDRDTGEFQGEVRLDGGIYFRGAAVINIPAAIRKLHGEDVVHRFALPFRVHFAVPVVIRQHVGNEGGIDHQFAHPITFLMLNTQQIVLRPPDGGLQIAGGFRRGIGSRLCPGKVLFERGRHSHTLRI
jgi:hypothetical protein